MTLEEAMGLIKRTTQEAFEPIIQAEMARCTKAYERCEVELKRSHRYTDEVTVKLREKDELIINLTKRLLTMLGDSSDA